MLGRTLLVVISFVLAVVAAPLSKVEGISQGSSAVNRREDIALGVPGLDVLKRGQVERDAEDGYAHDKSTRADPTSVNEEELEEEGDIAKENVTKDVEGKRGVRKGGNTTRGIRKNGNTKRGIRKGGNTSRGIRKGGNTSRGIRKGGNTSRGIRKGGNTSRGIRKGGNTSRSLIARLLSRFQI